MTKVGWHRQRLTDARSGTLGTISADGGPHLVPCCFVLHNETIYSAVDGKPKTTMALRRLDNIRASPVASLLVDHFDEDWSTLWWVRVDGTARVLVDGDDQTVGQERELALDLLVQKYSQYQAARPPGAVVAIDIGAWRSWSSG
jgi:PPOX class probable F420-dependent enzyme